MEPLRVTERLTRADWETINAALALYQAEDLPSEIMGTDPADDQAHVDRINQARRKVHQRLR